MAGQSDRGYGHGPVAGLVAADVIGVFELAQVDDQVAGGEPDHVLQAGEGGRVARGAWRPRPDDLQPGGPGGAPVAAVVRHPRCPPAKGAPPRADPPPPPPPPPP